MTVTVYVQVASRVPSEELHRHYQSPVVEALGLRSRPAAEFRLTTEALEIHDVPEGLTEKQVGDFAQAVMGKAKGLPLKSGPANDAPYIEWAYLVALARRHCIEIPELPKRAKMEGRGI
jgi:hypothetical protein